LQWTLILLLKSQKFLLLKWLRWSSKSNPLTFKQFSIFKTHEWFICCRATIEFQRQQKFCKDLLDNIYHFLIPIRSTYSGIWAFECGAKFIVIQYFLPTFETARFGILKTKYIYLNLSIGMWNTKKRMKVGCKLGEQI